MVNSPLIRPAISEGVRGPGGLVDQPQSKGHRPMRLLRLIIAEMFAQALAIP